MPNTVLIAGASGLVGAACVDRFLDDDWNVIAVSRRQPETFSDKPFRHLPLDLCDADATPATASRTFPRRPTWSTRPCSRNRA